MLCKKKKKKCYVIFQQFYLAYLVVICIIVMNVEKKNEIKNYDCVKWWVATDMITPHYFL